MRLLTFYTGLCMIVVEAFILFSFMVSKTGIHQDSWNFLVVAVMLVLINIVAITLLIHGLLAKE